MDNDTLIDRSISFFQQNGNMTDLANSYYYKGCANYVRGEMKESIFNLKKAEYLISNCDEEFANKLYERLVYANYRSGCKELALGYAKRFLDSSVELADSELIVRSLATIASCYYQQGQNDSAQYAISQCMPELHTMDKNLHASILSNLAKLCYDAGNYRQAGMYADSALFLDHQPFAYYVKGLIANRNGDAEKAKLFWNSAMDTDDEQLKILLNDMMATLQANQKQFEEAYQTKAEEMRLARQWEKRTNTERIAELQSQLDAEHSEQRFYRTRNFFIASAIVLIMMIVLLWLYHKKKKRDYDCKISELRDLDNRYRHVTESLAKAEEEMALLRSGDAELLSRKEAEISALQEQMEGMKERFGSLSLHDRETLMGNNETVLQFKEKAVPHVPNELPSESDWQRLMEMTEKMIPLFHVFLLNSNLSRQEMRVCLLTRLNFSNKEMSVLLDTTKQSISNSKSRANTKLFDDRNADTLLSNLKSIQ